LARDAISDFRGLNFKAPPVSSQVAINHPLYLPMYPACGPSPLRSSMTLCGWLLTTFPSSLPFQVPSSSLKEEDLQMKRR
jgi:hypothetical protein